MPEPARAVTETATTYVIGRDKECDIAIADDSVSRVHAELILSEGGKLLLRDRASANGTSLLRGDLPVRIEQSWVSLADRVQFGSVVLPVRDLVDAIQAKAAKHGETAAALTPGVVLGAKTWKLLRQWGRGSGAAGRWREFALVLMLAIAALLFWLGNPQSQSFKFLIGIVGSLVASLSFAVIQRYWDRK